ncbi:MAG: PepSY domain-containing protein [Candidatus Sericytochromatia bacterium]
MKRLLRRWHKWVGMVSCVFMLLVSGTALALNHRSLWLKPAGSATGFALQDALSWAADPFVNGHLLASDNHHLWRSRNGGQNWEEVQLYVPAEQVSGIAFDPAMRDRVWVALRNAGVFVSEDGGEIWEELETLPFSPVAGEAIVSLVAGPQELQVRSSQGLYTYAAVSQTWRQQRLKGASHRLSAQDLIWQLHTGQVFGSWGVYLYDLVAFSLILLSLSGLALGLRRKPRLVPKVSAASVPSEA